MILAKLRFGTFTTPLISFKIRPEINGKMEVRDCGNGCDLRFCLSIDEVITNTKQESLHLLLKAFEAAETYIQRFQSIREFYNKNLEISLEKLAENECKVLFQMKYVSSLQNILFSLF